VSDGPAQDDPDGSVYMAGHNPPIDSGNINPMAETTEPADDPADEPGDAPDANYSETAREASDTPESESDDRVGFTVYPHAQPYDSKEWQDILTAGHEQGREEFAGDSAKAAKLLSAFDTGVDVAHRYVATTQPEGWSPLEKPTIGIVTEPGLMGNIAITDAVSPVVYVGSDFFGAYDQTGP
jgi:hypothetical protein